jgi:hypothetical protein
MPNAADRLLDTVEWQKLPPPDEANLDGTYATHQGTLTIGDTTLRCYVLSDGQRLIDAEDVQKLLGL